MTHGVYKISLCLGIEKKIYMANLIIRMGTLYYLEKLTLVNQHFNVHINTLGWNKTNNEHEVH